MVRADIDGRLSKALLLISMAIVITGLYFASSILIPLALAMLFSFLLAPLVTRLDRWGVPRAISVCIVVMFASAVVAVIGWIVIAQLGELQAKLPQYRGNILSKVQRLRSSTTGLGGFGDLLKDIKKDLTKPATRPTSAPATQPDSTARAAAVVIHPATDAASPSAATAPAQPMEVRIAQPEPEPAEMIYQHLGTLVDQLASAGLAIVFVIFMLLGREDLRDRLIHLVSHGEIHVTMQAMDDAAGRISRYLLMQGVVNTAYGIPIAAGLYLIGVPNAFLWGLLAAVLRFIPYFGIWIAASMPILLALAVFNDYTHVGMTIGLYVVAEVVCYNAIEPLLYGGSTGLSAIAILASAAFWTWLWGVVGLFLATPLTVCLMVIGKYVPQLGFLEVLLSDEPVLSPPVRLYQRLLALDGEEASDLIDEYLEKQSLLKVYDEVLIPALGMAERDRHRGVLDEQQQQFIIDTLTEIVEELGMRKEPGAGEPQAPAPATPQRPTSAANLLCLPSRGEADEIVARMLAQVLAFSGCPADVLSSKSLTSEAVEAVATSGVAIVCISALPPSGVSHSRYLCARLRERGVEATVVVGLWTAKGDLKRATERLRCQRAGKVVRTLAEAVAEIVPLAHVTTAGGAPDTSAPKADSARDSEGRKPAGAGDGRRG